MSTVDYPAAPWQMHGQLWVSLFLVRAGDHPHREPGVYGVALVDYEEPSPLTYGELLVARAVREPVRGVTITDIWVDSEASMVGGRELWAIPKDLAEFDVSTRTTGPVHHATWTVIREQRPVCSAWFSDLSQAAPRLPFKGRTWQVRPDSDGERAGEEVTASLTGSSRSPPCRGSWSFAPGGPLGWLAGKRPLASFRMRDFQMSFG
jgi:acetoacetate decarboxylase